jgi:hypothetical protein
MKMASEREDNKTLADRLRGKTVADVREAGKQLSQQVGKAQTVKDISAPAPTPKLSQGQTEPARQRHVTEKQQNQIGSLGGGAPEQKPAQEKSVSAAGKDKNLAEMAKGLRESGVTGGRAANEVVAPAKNTPSVEQKQSRGRGR